MDFERPTRRPDANSADTHVVVGRHRLPETSDPGQKILAATAAGCLASGAVILYSQWPYLPQAWNTIIGIMDQLAP